jgi:Flp pilus assembly protein TadB
VLLDFVFMFGFLSVIRTIAMMRSDSILRTEDLPKIGIAVVLFGAMSVICSCYFPSVAVIAVVIYVMTALSLPQGIRWRRLAEFERSKVHFLSHLVMRMKTGESLRTALSGVVVECQYRQPVLVFFYQQLQTSLLMGEVSRSLCKMRAVEELARALIRAEKSSHHCVSRLQSLRELYQKRSDFRRRSGQVTTQLRAQAVLLALLYFALSIGMFWEYGTEKYIELRLLSLLLFFLGIIMIFYLGRRLRWKI